MVSRLFAIGAAPLAAQMTRSDPKRYLSPPASAGALSATPLPVAPRADPWMDLSVPNAIACPDVELFRYSGQSHSFADDESPDYVPDHAQSMLARVQAFLRR